MKQIITIEIEGDTLGEMNDARREAFDKIAAGFSSGFDSNDESSYSFNVVEA